MARGVFTPGAVLGASDLNDCFDAPRCQVFNSANISLATSATSQILTFNSERFDEGGLHSTSSNTSRLTIPTGGDGTYLVGAAVQFSSNATGYRSLTIRRNAAGVAGAGTPIGNVIVPAVNGLATSINVTVLVQLVAGDHLEVEALQNSGGALDVFAGSEYSPLFWCQWVGI